MENVQTSEIPIRIGEAAELLGVSVETLRRWADSDKVPSIRYHDGGHRRFRRSDIEAMKATA